MLFAVEALGALVWFQSGIASEFKLLVFTHLLSGIFFFLLTPILNCLNCICRELLESLYLDLTAEIELVAPYSSRSWASHFSSLWAKGSKSLRKEHAAAAVVNWTEELKNKMLLLCYGKEIRDKEVCWTVCRTERSFPLWTCLQVVFYFSEGFWRHPFRLHLCFWIHSRERYCLCKWGLDYHL